jgi:hypothetical protein
MNNYHDALFQQQTPAADPSTEGRVKINNHSIVGLITKPLGVRPVEEDVPAF